MENLNVSRTEREEIINASSDIRNDIALSGSPSCQQCPSLVNDFLEFIKTCSADTGTEIFHMFQKTLRAEKPTGLPGSGIIREDNKVKQKICWYWIFHYIMNQHIWHNQRHSFNHVPYTDFVAPVMRRRSKKPKQTPPAPRARVDNRHSHNNSNNHSSNSNSRRNIRSPWSNGNAYNRNQSSVPSKSISNNGGKHWSNLQGKYI